MTRNKKPPHFWFLLGIGCIIVLVFLILIVLPTFLNLDSVKSKISHELKERYQVSAQIASVSVRLLPRPKVILRDLKIAWDKTEAYVPIVSAYPKLWPILYQRLEIDGIVLERPSLKVSTMSKPQRVPEPLAERLKTEGEKFSGFSLKGDLQIKDASLEVLKKGSCFFKADSINLMVEMGDTQALGEERSWKLNISKLEVENPRVKCQGWLAVNFKKFKIAYDFEAQELDVTGLRKLLCGLFPEGETLKGIFSIIKAGMVKDLRMSQKALSKSEFRNLKDLKIEGRVTKAEVDIPKIGLKVQGGQGGITFKEGVLYGENLCGVVAGAKVSKAKITICIKDHPRVSNLQGLFTASLESGLFLLKKFVKADLIQKELGLISNAEGDLSGAIAINETSDAVDVDLEASLVKGNISYQRLPYPAFIDGIDFSYNQKRITWQGLKGRVGHSVINNSDGEVDLSTQKIFLNIKDFSGKLIAHELNPWLKKQNFLMAIYQKFDLPQGEVEISSAKLIYKFGEASSLSYDLNFGLRDSFLSLSFLPEMAQIQSGQGFVGSQVISFDDMRGFLGGGSFVISGEIKEPFTEKRQLRLWGEGAFTGVLEDWVYQLAKIPDGLKIKKPARVQSFKLDHSLNAMHLEFNLFNQQGVRMGFNLDSSPREFSIKELCLKDNGKECHLSLNLNRQKDVLVELKFKGTLSSETLDAMLVKNKYLRGIFTGDIKGKLDFSHFGNSQLTGHLSVEGLANIKDIEELIIEEMNIKATGQEVELEKIALSLDETALEGQGKIALISDSLEIKGKVFASVINWDEMSQLFSKRAKEETPTIKLKANIEAECDLFNYGDLTLERIGAFITVEDEKAAIEIWKGYYCNLELTGLITGNKDELALHISVQGENQDLGDFFYCVSKKRGLFEANYSLKGEFEVKGKEKPLQESSTGQLEFHSEKGRIYKFTVLAKIFSVLNVLEIFKGRLPDLSKEGLYYKHFDVSTNLKNGILAIDSTVIDGPAMKIFGQGTFNTDNSELKMTILVAPLRTIDTVLSKIPILGKVLTGKSKTFISVPLGVKGSIQDPDVKILPPSAIGKGILGIMKRTIGVPLEIFKPLTKKK